VAPRYAGKKLADVRRKEEELVSMKTDQDSRIV